MDGPRAATLQELPLVEQLANQVFRSYQSAPQTMFQEYPDLYDVSNLENIRIVAEDSIPVSNVNYLPQTIALGPCRIPAATLGGVSTLPAYRGRGHSTLLLADCIQQMERRGICVLHVSGDRHMYRAAGCLPAGLAYAYSLAAPPWGAPDIKLQSAGQPHWDAIARLYGQEHCRYIRSYDRMGQLMSSLKYIDRPGVTRQTVLLFHEGVAAAYFVLRIEQAAGTMVEWAGNKRLVLAAAGYILAQYGLTSLKGAILHDEEAPLAFLLWHNVPLEACRQSGTIRILSFPGLMEALRPWFTERCGEELAGEMRFSSDGESATFHCGNARFTLAGRAAWNDMILGGASPGEESIQCSEDLPIFQRFFRAVFPIPLPDTGNLSCV